MPTLPATLAVALLVGIVGVGSALAQSIADPTPTPGLSLETRRALALTYLKAALREVEYLRDERFRDIVLEDIADVQARAGDTVAARSTAKGITNEIWKIQVLGRIAICQAEVGDLPAALRTVEEFKEKIFQPKALCCIAIAQAQAGDIPGALRTARGMKAGDSWRFSALWGIAHTQAQAGDVPAALRIIKDFKDDYYKARALSDLAEVQAQAGDVPAALRMSESIKDGYQQGRALSGIAVAQAEAGDVPGALRTAASIKAGLVEAVPKSADARTLAADTSLRDGTLARIAAARARADDLPAAQRILTDRPGERYANFLALAAIAAAQARAGNIPGALRTAENITLDSVKAEALSDIADAQVQAGDVAAARRTIERVTGYSSYYGNQKSDATGRLAATQILSGYAARAAEQTLAVLASGKERALGYASLAKSLLADPAKRAHPRLDYWSGRNVNY